MPDASQELRGDQAVLSLLAPTYRLASSSIIFRWQAERDYLSVQEWREPHWSSSPSVLDQPLGVMLHCASQIKSSLTELAQNRLEELICEAKRRKDDMAEEWSMPARTECLERWLRSPPDSEFEASISQRIISESIVGASHWSYFVQTQKNLAGVLPQPLRAAFRLALLLAQVPYPSWKDLDPVKDWLSANPEHLIGKVGPRVHRHRLAIAEHTDVLNDLPDFIVGRDDPHQLACTLFKTIQERFDTLALRIVEQSGRRPTSASGVDVSQNDGRILATAVPSADRSEAESIDLKQRKDSPTTKAVGKGENVFRRVGTDWHVSFSGSKLCPLRNTAGVILIHYLLQRPNQEILASELDAFQTRLNLQR